MLPGFTLYVDESGDEGTDRVRPIDVGGASEYFTIAGVLIRTSRIPELNSLMESIKLEVGMALDDEIHFRDLKSDQKAIVLTRISEFKIGLIAVASNKRNMRGYRNLRVERKNSQLHRSGKLIPERYNWFYNHLFRYLMETASSECFRWAAGRIGISPKIDVVFSYRKDFRYSQTSAYLAKLQVERRPEWYFNNKYQINFRAADPFLIRSQRAKHESGLQGADCIASAIYAALDEDWLGSVTPQFLQIVAHRFVRRASKNSPAGYGFKLLPLQFNAPLSAAQKLGLSSVGYRFSTASAAYMSHASD
jgi:hypothetical protein